eukprot:TRINITY_DN8225_c1_g2_i1.p3 TRINITY_DN8225_c1_g2~~TRINITY_DN8225_c1_g2_i1.p3  ORF type:complete len:223 (+),score=-12.22 TRINITY_DN8225_c1_g2_i1:118-786(+)
MSMLKELYKVLVIFYIQLTFQFQYNTYIIRFKNIVIQKLQDYYNNIYINIYAYIYVHINTQEIWNKVYSEFYRVVLETNYILKLHFIVFCKIQIYLLTVCNSIIYIYIYTYIIILLTQINSKFKIKVFKRNSRSDQKIRQNNNNYQRKIIFGFYVQICIYTFEVRGLCGFLSQSCGVFRLFDFQSDFCVCFLMGVLCALFYRQRLSLIATKVQLVYKLSELF